MKKFKTLLLILLLIPLTCLFSACSFLSTEVYVTDIKETSSTAADTTYTIYYSNGKTSSFKIENGIDGQNGKDGQSLDMNDIKKFCEENNYDFNSFLNENFEINNYDGNDKTKVYDSLQTAVSVLSECGIPSNSYMGNGSGVIYSMGTDYSYILTNYHVVYDEDNQDISRKIHIFQYGTSELYSSTGQVDDAGYPIVAYDYGAIECDFIGGSKSYDIAVLKVPTRELKKYNSYAKAATIASSYTVADDAFAIGNPKGEGLSITAGIVSKESEPISYAIDFTTRNYRVLRIDTAVNSGNSGGGLFNEDGELIGIINAKNPQTEVESIAYALPIDCVEKVANNVIYYHEETNTATNVNKLYLGITMVDKDCHAEYITLKADVTVRSVDNKSFAYYAGLKVDDIVTKIKLVHADSTVEELDVRLAYQLQDIMMNVRAGDKIYFYGTRNGVKNTTLASKTIVSGDLIAID